jgi:hypothetical protein
LGLEHDFGGADALKPRRLVGDTIAHLVAAAIASLDTFFLRVGCPGAIRLLAPSRAQNAPPDQNQDLDRRRDIDSCSTSQGQKDMAPNESGS